MEEKTREAKVNRKWDTDDLTIIQDENSASRSVVHNHTHISVLFYTQQLHHKFSVCVCVSMRVYLCCATIKRTVCLLRRACGPEAIIVNHVSIN